MRARRNRRGVRIRYFLGLAALAWLAAGVAAAPAPAARLSVDGGGGLVLDGKPFRGIGVNVYDLFVRSVETPARTNADEVLGVLERGGCPFARFSASGYWPADWALYRTSRSEYFARLDTVVRAAERRHVGLIPSLFWNPPTLSDLAGEPVGDWGRTNSRTWTLARGYIAEVVDRYRGSPAIWAWEFGNEMNLPADLPNAPEHRPAVAPGLGTPAARGAADDLTHDQIRTALQAFAVEARQRDPARLLLSGNAFPRPSAWNQWRKKSWDRDTAEQADAMLAGDNPAPLGMLSGRLYSPADLARIASAADQGRRLRKPLFVGEFGVPGPVDADALRRFDGMLAALEAARVPMAALWVFDYNGQADDWNVTAANGRRPLWEAVQAWNRRVAGAAPAGENAPK